MSERMVVSKKSLLVALLVLVAAWFLRGDSSVITDAGVASRLDPSGNNPLSVNLYFETEKPVSAVVRLKDRVDPSHDLFFRSEATTTHSIDVWGLYQDFNNQLMVDLVSGDKVVDSHEVAVYVPQILSDRYVTTKEGDSEAINGHFILIGSEMYDKYGHLRWKLSVPNRQDVFPLADGLFAVLATGKELPTFEYQLVNIYDLNGYFTGQYKVHNGAHHDVFEKEPGGNLLVATHHAAGVDAQDMVVEIDRETKDLVRQWDYRDVMDQYRARWQERSEEDWAHINSVFYNEADNSLLVSSKLQNAVVSIDYSTGETNWILAPHTGWSWDRRKHLLEPTNFATDKDLNQDWTYLQHHATVLDNGDILVFDNGAGRPGFTDTPNDHDRVVGGGYVRAVRYSVDIEAMTVTKVGEWTDFPEKGSNNRGSVFTFADDKLLIGYAEFLTFVVRGGDTWDEVLMKWTFENNVANANRTFYRVAPYSLTQFLEL